MGAVLGPGVGAVMWLVAGAVLGPVAGAVLGPVAEALLGLGAGAGAVMGAGLSVGAAGEVGVGTSSGCPDEDEFGAVEPDGDVFASASMAVVGGPAVVGAGVAAGEPVVTAGPVGAADFGDPGGEGSRLGDGVGAVTFPWLSGGDVADVPTRVVPTLVDVEELEEDSLGVPVVTPLVELSPERGAVIPEVCGAGLVFVGVGSVPTAWRRELGSRDTAGHGVGGSGQGLGGERCAPQLILQGGFQAERSTKLRFN